MDKDYNPLVTIGVLTYNSAKYVLETLESAKAQTYQNIELIISDDCSKDNTVELCRKWVEENGSRFVRCEILTVEKNTGIPANCNRRLKASRGEWIKGIAGDDILAPDCIENFINFVKENPEAEWVAAHVQAFKGNFSEKELGKLYDSSAHPIFTKCHTARDQYKCFLLEFPIRLQGCILKTNAVVDCGGFDERFPSIEDWPLALNLSKSGRKCFYMDRIVCFYRIHDNSISNGVAQGKAFPVFYKKRLMFDKEYRLPFLSTYLRILYFRDYYTLRVVDGVGLNRDNFFCRKVVQLIYWLVRPTSFFRKIRTMFF